MMIEKITGGYCISDLIDGHLVTRRYFGHTKREALANFKRDTKK